MRLLIHAHAYPDFLRSFHAARPELATRTYAEQLAVIDRESHVFASLAWAEALAPLGYEVTTIVANDERLQRRWAEEHGVTANADTWHEEVAAAQIAAFRPDLLFFTSYAGLRPAWLLAQRRTCPSIRLLGLWCGMPFDSTEVFRTVDLVLTCVPELEERFRGLGLNAVHLHHGFDARVLGRLGPAREPDVAFSFAGQLLRLGGELHENRVRELERLAAATGIAIHSPAFDLYRRQGGRTRLRAARDRVWRLADASGVLDRRPTLRAALARAGVSAPELSERLRRHTRPAVFGLALYDLLRRSRVSYNVHGGVSPTSAANRRLWEATGVGSCLLTDDRRNLPSLFEPDAEVVVYRSTGECIDKARWLLDHPAEARRIAEAGQRRTLRDHTVERRAEAFDEIVQRALRRRTG